MKPLLSVDEARHYLGNPVSRTAFYDAVRRGDLPSIRLGRRLFIPLARLDAFLADTQMLPADPGCTRTPLDE